MVKKSDKEGKRVKISQAQQYMVLAVFGATLFLGAAIAVVTKSINRISYNANVIVNQDQSIVAFSDTIKNIGICTRPSGAVYTDEELKKCSPNSVSADGVPGTLRSNILENLASSTILESVANQNNTGCVNPDTGKNYTHAELEEKYDSAEGDEELLKASTLIKSCSALRVIPDALPAYRNEEALLASVDQIFRISGTRPESLSPTDEIDIASFGTNLYTISVRLAIEADTGTVTTLLNNVERSIRNFNIERATINWSSNGTIDFQARANAYYMDPSTITVLTKTIKGGK